MKGLETVICMECGKRYRLLDRHFAVHGLTAQEYEKLYPGEPTIAADILAGRVVRMAAFNQTPGQREVASRNGHAVGKANLARYNRSPENAARISARWREWWSDPAFKASMVPHLRRAAAISGRIGRGRRKSDQQRARQSATMKSLYESGAIEYTYRSHLENRVADVLEAAGVPFSRSKKVKGVARLLDFMLHDRKIAVEVDGCYWHGCPKCFPDGERREAFEADRVVDAAFAGTEWALVRFWEHELLEWDFDQARIMTRIAEKGGSRPCAS